MSPQATATPELAYDLAQANGMVEPVGGAAYYGSVFGTYLVAPVVALVSTPDHKGYWLIGADGERVPLRRRPQQGWRRGRFAAGPGGGRHGDS